MGTRSRIVIKRRRKEHVYFWLHWDGDFEHVGESVCKALRELLSKYDVARIQEMVERIESGNYDFEADDLVDVIEGRVHAAFSHHYDFAYSYLIDPYAERVRGRRGDECFTDITFEQLKHGVTFCSHAEDDPDYAIVERRQ